MVSDMQMNDGIACNVLLTQHLKHRYKIQFIFFSLVFVELIHEVEM